MRKKYKSSGAGDMNESEEQRFVVHLAILVSWLPQWDTSRLTSLQRGFIYHNQDVLATRNADEGDIKASNEDEYDDQSEDKTEIGRKRKRTKSDNWGGRVKKGGSFWDQVDKLYVAALKENGEAITAANQTVYRPSGDKWKQ